MNNYRSSVWRQARGTGIITIARAHWQSAYAADVKSGYASRITSKPDFTAKIPLLGLAFLWRLRYQAAMSDDSIESLAKKLGDAVPEGLRSMRKELEQNFRSVLRTGLGKLDVVTREEFEVQEAVLARTRERLEALEKRLAEFEKNL